MSSIMRARNALPGRCEEAEVIGGPLRAEGCWTFNARDQMPRSSPLTAHPLTATAKNAPASTPPSRESGFVPWRDSALGPAAGDGRLWLQIAITWAAARDVYVATASFSSCSDSRVALPPAAVVSIERV